MKIGVDLDDVVVNFFPKFLDFYNQKYGNNFRMSDMTSFNIWEVGIGRTKEEAIGFIDEFYDSDCYEKIPFVNGAKEGLCSLAEGNELYLITSRFLRYRPKTENFIRCYLPGYLDNLFFTEDFHNLDGRTKAEVCQEIGIGCYVEDCYEYAKRCAEKGIKVLLLDKPWNQNHEEHENIVRVGSWEEILNKIEEIKNV